MWELTFLTLEITKSKKKILRVNYTYVYQPFVYESKIYIHRNLYELILFFFFIYIYLSNLQFIQYYVQWVNLIVNIM
jgi:hypothetical protein